MIRVTLTLDLPEWWGADDAWEDGGALAVRDLANEDLSAFEADAFWEIKKIDTPNDGKPDAGHD